MVISGKAKFPFISVKTKLTDPDALRNGLGQPLFYFLGSSKPRGDINCQTVNGQTQAYQFCPPVNSIINKKVRAHMNGQWSFEDIEGNEAKGATKTALYKFVTTRPNVLQTWKQFDSQVEAYRHIFGQCYIYKLKPIGMGTPVALWVLPNWMVEPQMTKKFLMQSQLDQIVTGYKINTGTGGEKIDVPVADILVVRDVAVNLYTDVKNLISSQSRLFPLTDVVTNVTAAYEARNVMITRRGALGVLSSDAKNESGVGMLTPKEKTELQNEMQNYGTSKQQWQIIMTSAAMKWSPIAMPTKDLMLFEEVESGTIEIAHSFEYPPYLLGFKNNSTFNNVSEAKLALYQDAVIPEADMKAEAYSQDPDLGLGGTDMVVVISFDHLAVFQTTKKAEAEALNVSIDANMKLYQANLTTQNQFLQSIGLPPIPEGDKLLSETDNTPMAIRFGVGGTQALQVILSDPNLSDEQKVNIMVVLFSIPEEDARRIMFGKPKKQ